jgi:hypothetical protein
VSMSTMISHDTFVRSLMTRTRHVVEHDQQSSIAVSDQRSGVDEYDDKSDSAMSDQKTAIAICDQQADTAMSDRSFEATRAPLKPQSGRHSHSCRIRWTQRAVLALRSNRRRGEKP